MLDDRDHQIIDLLQRQGKLSSRKVSEITNIPSTTVVNKINRLEKLGVITGYKADIDFSKIGKATIAFMLISLDNTLLQNENKSNADVAKDISSLSFVTHATTIAGKADILVQLRVSNTEELNEKSTIIRTIKGVLKTELLIGLHEVKK